MASRKNQPAVSTIFTRVFGLALTLVLLSGGVVTPQTKRPRKAKSSPPPSHLTAREIARRSLPSVVVLVGRDEKGKAVTLGTGFFVAPRIIATNYHVIGSASRVTVRFVPGSVPRDWEEKAAAAGLVDSEYEIDGSVAINQESDLA